MTQVQRREFVEAFRRLPEGIQAAQLAKAAPDLGVSNDDITSIAGSDGVVRGDEEIGALYDKLAELDRTQPKTAGQKPRLEAAMALHRSLSDRPVSPPDVRLSAKIGDYGKALEAVALAPDDPAAKERVETSRGALALEIQGYAEYMATLDPAGTEYKAAQKKLESLRLDLAKVTAHAEVAFMEQKSPALAAIMKDARDPRSILGNRLKLSGMSVADFELYIARGEEGIAPKMAEVLDDLAEQGDYPPLGIMMSASNARAEFLRASAATVAEDDPRVAGWLAEAKTAAHTAKALPRTARKQRMVYAGKLLDAATRLEAKGDPKSLEKAEARKNAAREIYISVGDHYRKEVAKHPELPGNSEARRMAGLATASIGKMNQEAGIDLVANSDGSAALPSELAMDRRSGAEVAADATGKIDAKSSAEALYNEAEVLDPNLKWNARHNETRRDLREHRFNYNVKHREKAYPSGKLPVAGEVGPVDIGKLPPAQLLADITLDGTRLADEVRAREKVLDEKAVSGAGLDEAEWAERARLKGQGDRVALELDKIAAEGDLDKARSKLTPVQIRLTKRAGERTQAAIDKLDKEEADRKRSWELAQLVMPSLPIDISLSDGITIEVPKYKPSADYLKQRAELVASKTENTAAVALLERQQLYTDRIGTVADLSTAGLPAKSFVAERVEAATGFAASVDAKAKKGREAPPAVVLALHEGDVQLRAGALTINDIQQRAEQVKIAVGRAEHQDALETRPHGEELDKIETKANERANDKRAEWYEANEVVKKFGGDRIRTEYSQPIWVERPPHLGQVRYTADEQARLDNAATPTIEKQNIRQAAHGRSRAAVKAWEASNKAAEASGRPPLRFQVQEEIYVEKPSNYGDPRVYSEGERARKAIILDEQKDSIVQGKQAWDAVQAARTRTGELRQDAATNLAAMNTSADKAEAARGRMVLLEKDPGQQDQLARRGAQMWTYVGTVRAHSDPTSSLAALTKADAIVTTELADTRLLEPKEREARKRMNAATSDHVAEGTLRATRIMGRSQAPVSGALRGRTIFKLYELGSRANQRVIDSGVADLQTKAVERKGVFDTKLRGVTGFSGTGGAADRAREVAKGGKERFDKKMEEVLNGLYNRTQSSVSVTSNAAMWVFSGGQNMRAGMRAADKDAMRFARGDGDRTGVAYETGMGGLERMGKGTAEEQYEFAGMLHDSAADTTGPGHEQWRRDFYARADAVGLTEIEADAAYRAADKDPALSAWRNGSELDDFGALGALYTTEMGDRMFAPAYDTMFTTADILHKNHADLESKTKYLLLGIDAGIMVLGGELLAPLSSAFAAGTGLARFSGAMRAALGGGRLGNFAAGGFEGLVMLGMSKVVHAGAKLAGVGEHSDLMAGIDFGSGAFGFNVIAKGTAFTGLLSKYGMNAVMMGTPVVAGEFMSQEKAALVGDLAMVLAPAVFGAMGTSHRHKLSQEHTNAVLAHPDMAALRGQADVAAKVEGVLNDKAFNTKYQDTELTTRGLTDRRAELERRLADKGVPKELIPDIAARDTLEKAKQRHAPPKGLDKVGADAGLDMRAKVDAYYQKLEATMIDAGVPKDRARVLVDADKRALYDNSAATLVRTPPPPAATHKETPLVEGARALEAQVVLALNGEPAPAPKASVGSGTNTPKVGERLAVEWHGEGDTRTGKIPGAEHVELAILEGDLQVRVPEGRGPVIVNGEPKPAGQWVALMEGDTIRVGEGTYARRKGTLERVPEVASDAKVLSKGENGVIIDNGDGRTLTKIPRFKDKQLDTEQQALGILQQKGLDIGPELIGRVAPGELIIGRLPGQSLDKLSVAERKQIPKEAWDRFEADLGTMRDAGIHHNDLSAWNIMWDGKKLRLVDFGLAEIGVRSPDDLTRARKIRQAIAEGKEGQPLAPLAHPDDLKAKQKAPIGDLPFEPAQPKPSARASDQGAQDPRVAKLDPDSRVLFEELKGANDSKKGQAVAERALVMLADVPAPVRLAVLAELKNLTTSEADALLNGLARGDRLAILDTALGRIGAEPNSRDAQMLVRVLAEVPDTAKLKAFLESPVLLTLDAGALHGYLALVHDAKSPATQGRALDALAALATTNRHGGERVAVMARVLLPEVDATKFPDKAVAREQMLHALERTGSESGALAMLTHARNYDDPRVMKAVSRLADQEWFMNQSADDQMRGAKLLSYLYDLGYNAPTKEARTLAKNTVDQLLIADPPLFFGDMPLTTHGQSSAKGIDIARAQISADGAKMDDRSLAGTVSHEVFHHVNMRTGKASAAMEKSYRYFMDEYGAGLVGETVRLGRPPTRLEMMEWVRTLLTNDAYKPIREALDNPTEARRIVEFVNQFLDPPIDPSRPKDLLSLLKSDELGGRLKEPAAQAFEIDPKVGFITNNELSRPDGFVSGKTGAPDARSNTPPRANNVPDKPTGTVLPDQTQKALAWARQVEAQYQKDVARNAKPNDSARKEAQLVLALHDDAAANGTNARITMASRRMRDAGNNVRAEVDVQTDAVLFEVTIGAGNDKLKQVGERLAPRGPGNQFDMPVVVVADAAALQGPARRGLDARGALIVTSLPEAVRINQLFREHHSSMQRIWSLEPGARDTALRELLATKNPAEASAVFERHGLHHGEILVQQRPASELATNGAWKQGLSQHQVRTIEAHIAAHPGDQRITIMKNTDGSVTLNARIKRADPELWASERATIQAQPDPPRASRPGVRLR